jgi:mannose-6-phosphate isomerase-like protein (cupin superfamily)
MNGSQRWTIVDFEQLPQVPCPCGTSRRALLDNASFAGSVHRTEISTDAKPHFHRRLTETYYILQCDADAQIELDGQRTPLRPGMCVVIPPGVVHRAIGRMSILNIVLPKFDPADEVLVDG